MLTPESECIKLLQLKLIIQNCKSCLVRSNTAAKSQNLKISCGTNSTRVDIRIFIPRHFNSIRYIAYLLNTFIIIKGCSRSTII